MLVVTLKQQECNFGFLQKQIHHKTQNTKVKKKQNDGPHKI